MLGAARSQADTDTVAMLEIFAARKFADAVVEVSKEYAEKLREAGHTKSKEAAAAAMSQDPLALEDAEPNPNAGQVPPDLLVSSGLGDTFDAIAQYVVTQAWAVLHEVHEPPTVAARVLEALRQVLVSTFQLQPEKMPRQPTKMPMPMTPAKTVKKPTPTPTTSSPTITPVRTIA